MHQNVKSIEKELKKVKTNLQATLDANSILEAELHVIHVIEECRNTETKELSKKLTLENTYLELVKRNGLLLAKKREVGKRCRLVEI